MMGRKCCFDPAALINFNLSVPVVSVHCREYYQLSQAVNAFVHATDVVRVLYSDGVQLPVVEAEGNRAVVLGTKYY